VRGLGRFLGCVLSFAPALLQAEQHSRLFHVSTPIEQIDPLPAFEIPIRDLDVSQLQHVPGVRAVQPENGGGTIVFFPFSAKPWTDGYKWAKGADRLAKTAPFRTAIGGLSVKDARLIVPCTDGAYPEPRATLGIQMLFQAQGRNAPVLQLRGYAAAWPGMIEHEMRRDLMGLQRNPRLSVDGAAIGTNAMGDQVAVWKVNRQFYAHLECGWNDEFLAACIRRFGSQTPADFRMDRQNWVEEEIRLRVQQLDRAYRWQQSGKGNCVWLFTPYLTDQFPDLFRRFGAIDPNDNAVRTEKWFQEVRGFLWANRSNFTYSEEHWGFVLTGPDRFDASRPPALPPALVDMPASTFASP